MPLSPERPFSPRGFPIFYGWVVLVAGTVGVIGSVPGQTGGLGVFTDILMERLGLTRLQISTAYFLGTCASGILLPIGGRFFDRIGARITGAASAAGLGAAVLVLSQSDRIVGFLIDPETGEGQWLPGFILLTGCFLAVRFTGQGMLTISSRAMIAKWFQWRRGLVMSINAIVFTSVIAAAPKVLNIGIAEIGWRNTWMLLGVALVGGFAVLALILYRDNPEECGMVMDGRPPPPGRGSESNPDMLFVRNFTLLEALRTRSFTLFSAPTIVLSAVYTGFAFHILSVGREAGFEAGRILDIFLFVAAVSIPTNLVAGYIIDRTRLNYLLSAMGVAMVVSAAGLLHLGSDLSIVVTAVGMGVATGLQHLISGIIWPRYYGRAHLGSITGFYMAVTVIASGTGPWIFGLTLEFTGGYIPIYWATLIFGVIFALSSFAAENPQRILATEFEPSES